MTLQILERLPDLVLLGAVGHALHLLGLVEATREDGRACVVLFDITHRLQVQRLQLHQRRLSADGGLGLRPGYSTKQILRYLSSLTTLPVLGKLENNLPLSIKSWKWKLKKYST